MNKHKIVSHSTKADTETIATENSRLLVSEDFQQSLSRIHGDPDELGFKEMPIYHDGNGKIRFFGIKIVKTPAETTKSTLIFRWQGGVFDGYFVVDPLQPLVQDTAYAALSRTIEKYNSGPGSAEA